MAVKPDQKPPNRAERASVQEILRRRIALDKAFEERQQRRREALRKATPPAPEPFTDPVSVALQRVAPEEFGCYRSEVEEVLAAEATARQKSDVLARLGHEYRDDFLAALTNCDVDLADLSACLGPANLPDLADMDGGGNLTRLLTGGVAGAIRFENSFLGRDWSLIPEPEQPPASQPTDVVWTPPYIDEWGYGGGDSDDGLLSVEYMGGIGLGSALPVYLPPPFYDTMFAL